MMRNHFIIILLISVSYCYAQKTEVIFDAANNLTLKWNGKAFTDYTFADKQVNVYIPKQSKPVISVYW